MGVKGLEVMQPLVIVKQKLITTLEHASVCSLISNIKALTRLMSNTYGFFI